MGKILRSTDIKSALRSKQRGFLMNPFRFSAPGGGGSDPNWADVVRLLHMEGTNGGTTFTDSSPLAVAVTNMTGATTSTAQKQYGDTSAYLDGSHYLRTANPVFLDSLWTIELSFYMPAAPTANSSLFRNNGTDYPYYYISLYLDTSQQLTFQININSSLYTYTYPTALATGAWHSVAFVRPELGWVYGYVNGARVYTREIPGGGIPDADYMYIGSSVGGGSKFTGYIDEVRVTKAVRYTGASYTLATAAFPDA